MACLTSERPRTAPPSPPVSASSRYAPDAMLSLGEVLLLRSETTLLRPLLVRCDKTCVKILFLCKLKVCVGMVECERQLE